MSKRTERLLLWGAGIVGGFWLLRQYTIASVQIGYALCQRDRGESITGAPP